MNIQEGLIEMTFEQVKNEVLANMQNYVTDEAKNQLLLWIRDKILPSVKEMSDHYIASVKESAEGNNGWLRFRDTLLLPSLISGSLYLIEQAIDKVAYHD